MDAAARVEAQGRSVLHLEVGQPGTPAPRPVREAAHAAIDGSMLGYTVAVGLPRLRRRIAEHYQTFYGVDVDPEAVIVTPGASGAFVLAFLAAFAPRAEVVCARPGYPCYRNILHALDLVPVEIETSPERGYQLGIEDLERLPRTPAGLILASPANPTGTVLPPDELRALVSYCDERGIVVISDEIYHGLVYGDVEADTAIRYSSHAIVVNSFSKFFSMTGWRLGWMIVPPSLRRSIETLNQNLLICASALSQVAATAAFDAYEELGQHVIRYARNRDVLLRALRGAGVAHMAPADGAFYIYADMSRWTGNSRELCERMLHEIGVAATPGIDFDPERGHHMVRFSYCTGAAEVEEAARRIEAYLSTLGPRP